MRSNELAGFAATDYLNDGHAPVLDKARPHFETLIAELQALADDAPLGARLEPFRRCVLKLNDIADEIETVERECFCAALYALGNIVGLREESVFVDDWRGDW
jgi:hypothetical protein